MSHHVTPCVGVWIEIQVMCHLLIDFAVTPCVGVWIEIKSPGKFYCAGLVTPCVGVWIEIPIKPTLSAYGTSHSLRGSVD